MHLNFFDPPSKSEKLKYVEKNHLTSLKLSKFTPSTTLQSVADSDERFKSYGPKTAFFGHFFRHTSVFHF